jgi:hypothetical protein
MLRRLTVLLPPLALLACHPSGSGPAPLPIEQPLHLEEHLARSIRASSKR